MSETTGINLLPEEGRAEEKQRERRRLITIVSIGVVLVMTLLTGGSIAYSTYLKNQDSDYQAKVLADSATLQGLSATETLYRSIASKVSRLQNLLANYPKNSSVLDDVAAFTPSGVSLTSLTFDSAGKVAVTGVALGPTAFGDFVNILKDPKTGGAKFTSVEIVSVSGGGQQGDYRFSLSMSRK